MAAISLVDPRQIFVWFCSCLALQTRGRTSPGAARGVSWGRAGGAGAAGGVEGLHLHCVSVLHLWQALERRVGVQPSQGDGDSARPPVGSSWGQLHTSAHITPASPSSRPAEASQGSSLCAWLLEDRGDAARPGL